MKTYYETEFQRKLLELISSEEELNHYFNTTIFSKEDKEIKNKCRSAMIYGIIIAALHISSCDSISLNDKEYINKNELIKWLEGNKFICIDENLNMLSEEYEKKFALELNRNTFINKIIKFLNSGE